MTIKYKNPCFREQTERIASLSRAELRSRRYKGIKILTFTNIRRVERSYYFLLLSLFSCIPHNLHFDPWAPDVVNVANVTWLFFACNEFLTCFLRLDLICFYLLLFFIIIIVIIALKFCLKLYNGQFFLCTCLHVNKKRPSTLTTFKNHLLYFLSTHSDESRNIWHSRTSGTRRSMTTSGTVGWCKRGSLPTSRPSRDFFKNTVIGLLKTTKTQQVRLDFKYD